MYLLPVRTEPPLPGRCRCRQTPTARLRFRSDAVEGRRVRSGRKNRRVWCLVGLQKTFKCVSFLHNTPGPTTVVTPLGHTRQGLPTLLHFETSEPRTGTFPWTLSPVKNFEVLYGDTHWFGTLRSYKGGTHRFGVVSLLWKLHERHVV